MGKIKNFILSITVVGFLGGAVINTIPQNSYAAGDACTSSFLGFPAWYRGLTNASCDLKSPGDIGLQTYIWTIVFNIVEMALRLVGYICVAFILYGGFTMIKGTHEDGLGNSNVLAKGKKMILNAVIGLAISIMAVAIVNFIFKGIFGA